MSTPAGLTDLPGERQRIAGHPAALDAVQGGDLVVAKRKLHRPDVLHEPLRVGRLRDDGASHPHEVGQHDLGRGRAVLVGDRHDLGRVEVLPARQRRPARPFLPSLPAAEAGEGITAGAAARVAPTPAYFKSWRREADPAWGSATSTASQLSGGCAWT